MARLKERYENEIRGRLQEELELSSVMQVPRVTKVTLNMGVGEAKTDAKAMDAAIDELNDHRRAARARSGVRPSPSPASSFERGCLSAHG